MSSNGFVGDSYSPWSPEPAGQEEWADSLERVPRALERAATAAAERVDECEPEPTPAADLLVDLTSPQDEPEKSRPDGKCLKYFCVEDIS